MYYARIADKWYLIFNGKISSEPYDGFAFKPEFSANGKHYAYSAIINDHGNMFIDGIKEPYSGILQDKCHGFSPDSKHYQYNIQLGNTIHNVVDGKLSSPHTGVSETTWSSDGSRWAYFVMDNNESSQSRSMYLNGVKTKTYNSINSKVYFSNDNMHYAYCAQNADGDEFVVTTPTIVE
jgi:hypothetical protein